MENIYDVLPADLQSNFVYVQLAFNSAGRSIDLDAAEMCVGRKGEGQAIGLGGIDGDVFDNTKTRCEMLVTLATNLKSHQSPAARQGIFHGVSRFVNASRSRWSSSGEGT